MAPSPPRPGLGSAAAAAAWRGLSDATGPDPPAGGPRLLRLPGEDAVRGREGWREAVGLAVSALRAGGVIAVPTDTLYGLACSALSSAALGDVYRIKGRGGHKPLALCLGSVADVYRFCVVRVPRELLQDLLPGPVTLVMERSHQLSRHLNPFTPLVGIRIPRHAFMQQLVQKFSGPLALTSANVSSQASSLTVAEFQDLWPQLSLIVDGGPIGDVQSPECRLGSTVVDLSVPGEFSIIRPGCALTETADVLQRKYGLQPSKESRP
ncbi:yrdC domain-containing protein, mitochondrial isoform X1 [Tachyglossus aculeatus]|uniref:yrdC domain-containing protein, mitochondrial isoform X1 n=1 Tax=Tachyglossus aculeatus TaxID=9261 RepID=UPI0018F64FE1|nr:yrdC domain-containing protein, mitochondrial isoform X1 [Tachyglossus aculeatus]